MGTHDAPYRFLMLSVPACRNRRTLLAAIPSPGLIDGFAAQRSQGQANAHLAMGVTTIVGMSDDRRGLLLDEDPQPHLKRLDDVNGYDLSGLDRAQLLRPAP